jgi:TolB-like protein
MGRVVQRGDDLSVSVELVNAREDKQLWGEQYTRKLADIASLQ